MASTFPIFPMNAGLRWVVCVPACWVVPSELWSHGETERKPTAGRLPPGETPNPEEDTLRGKQTGAVWQMFQKRSNSKHSLASFFGAAVQPLSRLSKAFFLFSEDRRSKTFVFLTPLDSLSLIWDFTKVRNKWTKVGTSSFLTFWFSRHWNLLQSLLFLLLPLLPQPLSFRA